MINVDDFIGIPYVEGGRTLNGADCWGVLRLVYKSRLDVTLPLKTEYTETLTPFTSELIEQGKVDWTPIASPEPYDLILFFVAGEVNHIGMCLGDGFMLHSRSGTDSCVEKYTSPRWFNRIEGFYRLDPLPGH